MPVLFFQSLRLGLLSHVAIYPDSGESGIPGMSWATSHGVWVGTLG